MNDAKVYLAGPDVFLLSEDIGTRKKDFCRDHGFVPLFPLDNEISGENARSEIFKANLRMIARSDAVLANISPFRGPHCDPGTAFEVGYALAANKPVITYSNDNRELIVRMRESYPDLVRPDISIEDFGVHENLMMVSVSEHVCVDCREDLSAWEAFKQAVVKLSQAEA